MVLEDLSKKELIETAKTSTDSTVLNQLASSYYGLVRQEVASNKHTSKETLQSLLNDSVYNISYLAKKNLSAVVQKKNTDKNRILVVDDETATLDLVTRILRDSYHIKIATSGTEALDLLQRNSFDLILLDIHMPQIDGFEVVKQFMRFSKSNYTPFIFITGDDSDETIEKGFDLGALDFITKPLDLKVFANKFKVYNKYIKKNIENKKNSLLAEQYKSHIDKTSIVSKTDTSGKITYVNKRFCETSGYTQEELLGKNQNIIRHPDNPSHMYKKLWDTIKSKQFWEGTVRNINKEGDSYYVKTTICPILDHNDEIAEFLSIRQDITELELYKEAIEEQLAIATKEIIDTQKEVVYTMGAIGETRSKETGLHVKRVAEYSYLLGRLYGLEEEDARLLKQASPMHDIGKVGIPDDILNKPGKLTKDEFEVMKIHSKLGYEMLKHSDKSILKAAAVIAHQHHEKYDGSGYPNGLKKDEIHIYGRITAIVDVFDALGHDRVYKKAWPMEKILELLEENKGSHFDPVLVDIFLNNLERFLEIKNRLGDEAR